MAVEIEKPIPLSSLKCLSSLPFFGVILLIFRSSSIKWGLLDSFRNSNIFSRKCSGVWFSAGLAQTKSLLFYLFPVSKQFMSWRPVNFCTFSFSVSLFFLWFCSVFRGLLPAGRFVVFLLFFDPSYSGQFFNQWSDFYPLSVPSSWFVWIYVAIIRLFMPSFDHRFRYPGMLFSSLFLPFSGWFLGSR